MSPANFTLSIFQGITFGPLLIQAKDASGAAVNLTGYTPEAEIRKAKGRTAELIRDLAPVVSNAAGGEIRIALTDEQTAALPAGRFEWDLVLLKADGTRLGPYVAGAAIVSPIVTQP